MRAQCFSELGELRVSVGEGGVYLLEDSGWGDLCVHVLLLSVRPEFSKRNSALAGTFCACTKLHLYLWMQILINCSHGIFQSSQPWPSSAITEVKSFTQLISVGAVRPKLPPLPTICCGSSSFGPSVCGGTN